MYRRFSDKTPVYPYEYDHLNIFESDAQHESNDMSSEGHDDTFDNFTETINHLYFF